jgi:hypothetical protein
MTDTSRLFCSLALIVALTLGSIPAQAKQRPVEEQIANLGAGEKIRVLLANGEIVKGRLGAVAPDQFTLEPRDVSKGTAHVVKFSEVRSVKQEGGMSRGAKLGITVGLIAGGCLTFLFIVAAHT